MKAKWRVGPITSSEKRVLLIGPDGFSAKIDFDDVDHKALRKTIRTMVSILNEEWAGWVTMEAHMDEHLKRMRQAERAAKKERKT